MLIYDMAYSNSIQGASDDRTVDGRIKRAAKLYTEVTCADFDERRAIQSKASGNELVQIFSNALDDYEPTRDFKLQTAAELLKAVLIEEPHNLDANQWYIVVLKNQEKMAEVFRVARNLIEFAPDNVDFRIPYAQALTYMGCIGDAKDQYNFALQSANPDQSSSIRMQLDELRKWPEADYPSIEKFL